MTSRRQEIPVTSVPYDLGGTEDSHPAFGTVTVARSSGSSRSLFQSDVLHPETITLRIHDATRIRDLNHDRVHPRKEIIEIEMSLAQWGAVVSSIGVGSGVPVTIRSREGDPFVPLIPHQPRIAANLEEVRGSVDKLLARTKDTFALVEEAIEAKKGIRAIREALHNHRSAIQNASANSAFAVTSMAEAAEHLTSQVRADIESQVLSATSAVKGRTAIALPEITLEVPSAHVGSTTS